MNSKADSRIRRAAKTRIRISQQDKPRLSVFKSSQNLYAQIFAPNIDPKSLAQEQKVEHKLVRDTERRTSRNHIL